MRLTFGSLSFGGRLDKKFSVLLDEERVEQAVRSEVTQSVTEKKGRIWRRYTEYLDADGVAVRLKDNSQEMRSIRKS